MAFDGILVRVKDNNFSCMSKTRWLTGSRQENGKNGTTLTRPHVVLLLLTLKLTISKPLKNTREENY
jgi:hypothetical protein